MKEINFENTISNLELNIGWICDNPAHQFPGYGNVETAMRDALELLKKQRQKETPQLADDIQKLGGQLSAFCPSCGRGLYDNNLSTKYCYSCGQAVKWG